MAASFRKSLPRISLAVLSVYWAALFVGTHVPRFEPTLPMRHSDKWLHASAFFVLAVLVAWAWSLRGAFGWRQALAAFAILALYGVIDEITQIPVGRDANVADWTADMLGSLSGLATFFVARAVLRLRAGFTR